MTIWPGDKLTADSGETYVVEHMVAYMGKPDCTHPMCRRRSDEPGCMGYHCSLCDEPTGMMGHDCPDRPSDREDSP